MTTFRAWQWNNPEASDRLVDNPYRTVREIDGWDDVLNPRGSHIVHARGFLISISRGDRKARAAIKAIRGARFIASESGWFIPAGQELAVLRFVRDWMPECRAFAA